MNSDSVPCLVWGWFSRLPKCSAHWCKWSSFIFRILPTGSFRMLDTGWYLSLFFLRHLYISFKLSFLVATSSLAASFSQYHSLSSWIHWFCTWLKCLYSLSLPHSPVVWLCSMMPSVHSVIHSFHGIWLAKAYCYLCHILDGTFQDIMVNHLIFCQHIEMVGYCNKCTLS